MIRCSRASRNLGAGKPLARVLLFPHDDEFKPFFDSHATLNESNQKTIEEVVNEYSKIHGDLIEDDFLELGCKIEIDFFDEGPANPFEVLEEEKKDSHS